MLRNETKLMESAIALAEELHFQRAARKLRISQPMLTKNIQDLESVVGGPLFERDRKHVVLTDAGRSFVEHARISLLYAERAVQSARAAMKDVDVPLHVGRSPYIDPFLVSTLLSIQLPLYPRLTLELSSQYSPELVDSLIAGTIDLAMANQPMDSPLLTQVQISESPFYIGIARRDELAMRKELSFGNIDGRKWIVFERRLNPSIYDEVFRIAELKKSRASSVQHVTVPEEAFPFIFDGEGIAILTKAGALRLARNGVTVRPLCEESLTLRTFLVSRADNDSKIVSELVRAYMRKLSAIPAIKQMELPIQPRLSYPTSASPTV